MASGKKPESFISKEIKKKNNPKPEKPAVADTSKTKQKTGQRKK